MRVSVRRLLRSACISGFALIVGFGLLVISARAAIYTAVQTGGTLSWTATSTSGPSLIWNCTTSTVAGDTCGTYPGQLTLPGGIVDSASVNTSAGPLTINVDSAIPNPVTLTVNGMNDTVDGITGGSLNLAGPSAVTSTGITNTLSLDGGTLSNTGTLTITGPGATFNLNRGTLSGNGTTSILSSAIMNITATAGPMAINQQTIANGSGGTGNFQTGGTLTLGNGATINNQPGAFFNGNGGATVAQGAGTAFFNNAGTLQDVLPGGFTIGVPGGHIGATWNLGAAADALNFGGTHVFNGAETFIGTGTITINAGGGWSINTSPALLALPSGASLVNNGTIDFGTTIHSLALNSTGTFTQTATGVLKPKLGPPNGTSDVIGVANTATLAGTLLPSLGTGYIPADGDSFTVLAAGLLSGTFTYTPLPYAHGAFLASYSPTGVVLTATPMANISITNVGPPTVADGQNATFTVTISNAGPAPTAAVQVTDSFPAGAYVSATPSTGSCSGIGPTSCNMTVPIGSPQTITMVLKAGPVGPFTNSVSVSPFAPLVNTGSAGPVVATTTVTPVADLSLTSPITSTPAVGVNAASTETFFIAYNNLGPDTATSPLVTFSLTGGTITSASSTGWTCTTSQCTIPTLVNGAAGTITVVTTAQNQAGSMTLTANISAASTDLVPTNNSASSAAVPVIAVADLAVTKTLPALVAGSNATYTITVNNLGPSDAAGVTLTDPTPAGLTFVSASAPCSAGVASCTIGTIPALTSTTITATYSVASSATGSIANTASVGATTTDPVPTNNTFTVTTPVVTKADLSVTKTGPATAPPGANITYTISVMNIGPSDAQSVQLTDPTPPGLSFVSASGVCSSFPCSIATIPAGQTKTVLATYKVVSGPVTNVATVTSTTTDPNPLNNSASFTTTTAVTCPSAPPANPAPADGSSNVPTTGALSWSGDGASSYTVYLDVAGPNACSKFFGSTSGTSIPYAGLQQGTTYQWRIVASASGCPAVQTTSCMTFTTTATCPQTAPTLISPLGTTVSGPATFNWSSVAGATDYRLFVNGSLIATTTSTSFGPVPVGSGSVSWYVVADFASPCGSLQSPPGSFNGCDTSTAPIVSVVGESAAGQSYEVTWNAIPGATQYQIDEAVDASFNSPATQSVTTTGVSFSHTVITTTAYFYRVRAFIPCANGYSANSIPVRVVLTPLNIVSGNPNVAAPTGSTTRMQVIVHVPGFADGSFPFTASLDQPWLIALSPSTGVLPPQGIDLTVTVDPTGLPNGTWTGTVILTIGSGKNGLLGTNGTTTVSSPISISLVTPVTPKAAGTPSADTLIIPSLGHLDGINSQWQSDVRLANLSSSPASYQVTFTPADTSQMPRQTVINVDPGVTTALDDVVNTWFGIGALGDSANGVLQIQPMQISGKDNSVSVSFATAVSSRTYSQATNSNGTYGQFIPAIPFSNFVGAAIDASHPATVLGLQQIAQSSAYRTNVGVVEGAGQPATVLISAFDDAGNKLLDSPLSLLPNQQVQLNSFLSQNGIPLSDGRLQIKVLSGTGMITTYASVIDNRSGDPLLMSGVPIGQTVSSNYVVPGVADLNTANAAWRTDMRIFNPSSTAQFVTATFYPQNNGTPQTTGFTVNPGQIDRIDGVLASLFNGAAANMGGALHLSLGNPASLMVTGRTYNFASNGGTYGQFIPAVTSANAVGNGDRALQILQTEDSVRYRTNIGIAEVTGNPATIQISVVLPNSKVSPSTQIPLQPNEFIQIPVIQSLGLTNVYNARISVQVVGGTGKIAAYGSVIDQTTQAPTYIPAQ